jgi:hypothetical protein
MLAVAMPIALGVGWQSLRAAPPRPPPEALQSLVEDYGHAIETNNHELALLYIHPRSPARSEISEAVREQLQYYQEKVTISNFETTHLPDGTVSAKVDQEFMRIFGLKITRGTRQMFYRFRPDGRDWRVWEIEERGAL